jgi:hypothetical protein
VFFIFSESKSPGNFPRLQSESKTAQNASDERLNIDFWETVQLTVSKFNVLNFDYERRQRRV